MSLNVESMSNHAKAVLKATDSSFGWRSDKWSETGSSIGAVPVLRILNSTWKVRLG
jgi:hypothetical protein